MSRSRPVLPYRVLPDEFVLASPDGWNVVVDGKSVGQLQDGTAFPAWDAKLSFTLEREFRIERDIADELQIDNSENCCEFVVTASSGGGITRDTLFTQPVSATGCSCVEVMLTPASARLARDLVLTSGIYLTRDISPEDPLAPKIAGSRLWEMTERVRLEGGAARLPMYEVPFSQFFPGDAVAQADFHVEIVGDPDLEIETALTVYVNSERPEFIAELNRQGSAAEQRLWNGVIRRVLTSAILTDEILTVSPGEGSSLAATVQRWARYIWPTTPFDRLGDLPLSEYSKYEAQIESWLHSMGTGADKGGSK